MKKQFSEFTDYMRVEKNYSEKTIREYGTDIAQYIDFAAITCPEDMSKANIRSFLAKLTEKQLSATTRNRKLAAIRSFCKFMCEEGYLKFNPAADLSTAKTETKLPVVFSEIDTGKLIDSVSDIRDRAALETLYALGIRVAELVGIQVKDIDFINRRVRVFGKGRKERVVPMNNSAKNILLEYISTLERNDLDDYVFPSPVNQGKPVTTRAMYDVVIKYAKLNGMDGMSPHKFRHAFATHMHARGMDIRDLQELLGHADIGTTTIYTKVVNENLARNYHSAHPRG